MDANEHVLESWESILVHFASTNVNVEYDDIFKDEIYQKYMYSEHKQHVIVFRHFKC